MMFVGIDPGRNGGLAIVSDSGELISVNSFTGGLPNIPYSFRFDKDEESHYEIWVEFADWKNAEMVKHKINLNTVYKAGFYVGLVHHDMYMRGASEISLVAPKEWQKIFKGIPGKGTKERALNYFKARFNDPDGAYLQLMNVIGPRGGYNDGMGDAILIALWARDKWQRQSS